MNIYIIRHLLFSLLLISITSLAQTPDDIPDKPGKKLVYDYAQVMSAVEQAQLERKLVAYNDSTSTQIAIITLKELKGYPLETLAAEIGQRWGVGQKGKENGIVILLSKDDRKITIRTGYGAQIHLTPIMQKQVIDRVITPRFKEGNYYAGLDDGTTAIIDILAGKYEQEEQRTGDTSWVPIVFFLIFIAFIFFVVIKAGGGGNDNSGGKRKRSLFEDIIIMNPGRMPRSGGFGGFGSGSGGGFGGGGFGGFGGGSFGGGGASGSW